MSEEFEESGEEGIAVIGMSGSFPGAADVTTFWRNLREGRESIVRFSDEELAAAGVSEEERSAPDYVPYGAPLADVELFDAAFFSLTPREAEIMDPQHRFFLQCCYHALEDAGLVVGKLPERVGVFGGSRVSDYLTRHLYANGPLLEQVGPFQAVLSNDKDYLAPLVSYKLDLDGPSVALQTACSTSLVAVHFASESLLSHNCNIALAGGVTIRLPQQAGYHAAPGGIFSPTGQCRAFDAGADGTVFGNGVGVVVLKRLEDALADGDAIYGQILGSAVNNDGGRKVGLTAPSAEGQARVIADALAIAEVEPEELGYIECHGTGTALGDAIEVAALAKVFDQRKGGRTALGAVKTNVGHLEAAAGMAGLLKVLLMLSHRRLVPSLHFSEPNPQIGFEHTPFYVNTEDRPWESDGRRLAGLSSFGIGGTNAHLILAEAPPQKPKLRPEQSPQPLCISARDEAALTRRIEQLKDWLQRRPDTAMADLAATLYHRRRAFPVRAAVVAGTAAEAVAALDDAGLPRTTLEQTAKLTFLFPGQGSQYAGMARRMYAWAPVFRETVDRGARCLEPTLGRDIRTLLLAEEEDRAIHATELAQPALFLVGYAMARQWRAWGAEPEAMLGHSVGEYVAAALADVFSFEDGLNLVATRGKIMAECPRGAMLSVALAPHELTPYLLEDTEIAAYNSPTLTVVSGGEQAVEQLSWRLQENGVQLYHLNTSHGFHGAAMESAVTPFQSYLEGISFKPPSLPFISNTTGTWISDEQACDPAYWAGHLRRPVRFNEGLQTIAAAGRPFWLELGPGRGTLSMARAAAPGSAGCNTMPGARKRDENSAHITRGAQARLWTAGILAGPPLEGGHLRLPGYPFAKHRHWVPAGILPGTRPVISAAPSSPQPSTKSEPLPARADLIPAEGEVEIRLAAIWSESLGIEPIGRFDDFFELGGHSLLATRVLSRLAAEGLHLTLQDFFEGAQLARLAGECRRKLPTGQVPLSPSDQPPIMSAAQERFWFLYKLAPHDPAYNLPGAFALEGPLSVRVLEYALNDLSARHEILRWRFPSNLGRPDVAVSPPGHRPLTCVDLSALAVHEQAEALETIRKRDAWTPFDLEREPPWRAALVRQSTGHTFLMNLHHIISDGGSFAVLSRDLGAAMRARLQGRAPQLPELRLQYGDFAHWQRRTLSGERLQALETYWRGRLADAPFVFELDTDFPRPTEVDARGGRAAVAVDAPTTAALNRLARHHNAGMFMCLMTAFQLVLWNRSGKRLFLVGTDVTHRNHRDLEPLLGLFVNHLVMRADLNGNPTLAELLGRVREDILGGLAHQDLPFERLVEMLKPPRDLGVTPLFQVRFVYQNHPPLEAGGQAFRGADVDEKEIATRHDLRLELHERRGKIGGFLEYRKSLFAHETMNHLAQQFQQLVGFLAHEPELPLNQLSKRLPHLPPTTERLLRNVMVGAPLTVTELLPDWLRHSTATYPDRTALKSDWEPGGLPNSYSYSRLTATVEALARRLRARGVGTETIVGICLDRSCAMLVGAFATWRSGGGFLPMDHRAPASWLAFQIEQSGCRHILTLSGDTLPSVLTDRCEIIRIDDPTPAPEVSLPEIMPEQTAYVLFTSGSTGKSKAVAVSQANLALYSVGVSAGLDKTGGRWAWVQSALSDAWLTGLGIPLMAGGCIYPISAEAVGNPERYLAFTAENPVDCIKIMPSVLKAMQAGGRFQELLPEELLILGGEPAEVTWVQAMAAERPSLRIFNHYGITETTVGNIVRRLDGNRLAGQTSVPLGKALPGVAAYVVDGFDRPVAPAMHGELHLAGGYLARGYLAQPGLTATRFLPDPWSEEPGARRYATGDVVRTNGAAELYFQGRADHQVKIRGFRVEPGEVENQLRQTGKIAHGVVRLIRAERPFLAAYVVPKKDVAHEGLAETLHQELASRVPAAMVPARFVILKAMPHLPNGKIDMKALPLPEIDATTGGRPPETPMEQRLAAVWAQVLGKKHLSADDNFFSLGGDSLLSIRVTALANRAGMPLTTATFFRNQTLAEQARWLENNPVASTEQALVALQPAGRKRPLFCMHAAGGMIYNYIELARALGPEQPLYALQDPAFMGRGRPQTTIEAMAERYLGEILEVQPEGPFALCGHSMGGLIALELAHRLQAKGQTVALVAMFDTRTPGHIAAEQDGDQHLVVLHHLLDVMYRGSGQTAPLTREELRPQCESDRLERASAALRSLPGCTDFTPERLSNIVAAYVAHAHAARAYQPPKYEGPITLFRPKAEAASTQDSGWNRFAKEVVEIQVAGDHTTMLARTTIKELAQALGSALARS